MDSLMYFGDMEAFCTHRAITCLKAKHLASEFGLEAEWEYFNSYNKAAGLSYHNRYHSCFMMAKCDSMAEQMGLSQPTRKALCLAAMFHDFNHSGGVVSDRVNIGNAIAGLINATRLTNSDLVDEVSNLISVTEYPFVHKPDPGAQRIIRDADVLQGCTPFFAKTIYCDLFSELLVSKPSLNFYDFGKGQRKFLEEVEMFTEIGKKEKAEFLESWLQPFCRRFDRWGD